jgi:hypothetical protein
MTLPLPSSLHTHKRSWELYYHGAAEFHPEDSGLWGMEDGKVSSVEAHAPMLGV